MARLMLSDELWSKLKGIMLQHHIYNKPNLPMMVEGMLYRMRVACPCNHHNSSDIIALSPYKLLYSFIYDVLVAAVCRHRHGLHRTSSCQ